MLKKRYVLAKGKNWFYKDGRSNRYNLIGMLDDKNQLLPFEDLPQSQYCRLVLEVVRKPPTKKKAKNDK